MPAPRPEQKELFAADPAPWEHDDAAGVLIARVVFPTGPQQPFDYEVPEVLRSAAAAGRRVRAPLGRGDRSALGYCVELAQGERRRRLKLLEAVVDRQTLLSPAMLRLTEWMADYYLCGWGQVLEAVVPAGVRGQAGTREVVLLSLADDALERVPHLKLPAKQAEVVARLAECGRALPPGQLAALAACTLGPIQSLRRKGVLVLERRRVQQAVAAPAAAARELHLDLELQQQAALAAILEGVYSREPRTILVHGVTGSGKTEVYIQAIQEVLRMGRQAIVLVPEISLTPQTCDRFRARFDQVAVLHSHLSDVERHWHWQRIAAGEVQVVVGARSAIFAPTPRLGLIVLDEEHEGTFKQETAPRYHARDVALARARLEEVTLVLGSATPSLESWLRAQRGEFRLVSLPNRIGNRPLPDVATLNLRAEFKARDSRGSISRSLHRAMEAALRDGGQVILLLNRRGYSTHIQCPACGLTVQCPHCDIALTHHRTAELAICHYCDYTQPVPRECPDCHFQGIRYRGLGTQRLEAEVRARFPNYACLRMDTDAMQGPHSHEQALAAFRTGEVQILLGTQMIAKGLDFPRVTLVGVVNADTALHLPDFRAAERTFQLVTQVAGRSGRGDRGGRVLVQTLSPDHPAIQAAVRHDFDRFAAYELPIREKLGYPPFTSMVRLVVRGPVAEPAGEFAQHVADRLGEELRAGGVAARILGPAPAPIARLRGLHRFHLQAQAQDGPGLRGAAARATADLRPPENNQWIVDVDPLDML
jgi:primosomal protein N' (replication factor Y)